MRRLSNRHANRAMTLLEVLVVIVVLLLVMAMLLPAGGGSRKSPLSSCINHLRQIDLAFLFYAGDYNGKFPIQTSVTNGSAVDFPQRNQTFPHYQKISQYNIPVGLLICPTDKTKHAAGSFADLTDANLSYFLNADVSIDYPATSILAGDRNLQANGQPVSPGVFVLTTNLDMGWSPELHRNAGVLAFADGHAEYCRTTNLDAAVKRQNAASSRLFVP